MGTLVVDDVDDDLERFVSVDYPVMVAALGLVCGSQAAAEDGVQDALARRCSLPGQAELAVTLSDEEQGHA